MKYLRKGIALVLALVITCGVYSPQVSEVEAASKKVSPSAKKMTMYVGETRAVPIKKPVKKAQIKKVKIKSSNMKVVKVSKGNLVAKKKGKATITVTYQKQKASIKVTVKPKVKSTSITLNYKKKTVTTGKSFNLKVKKVKGLSTKSVSYKTSNKKVATVTSKGKVVGKAAGRATITVTSKSNKKIKAKCKVTVKKKTETHKYGGYNIDVKPTCTKAGSKSKHCLIHPNSKSCRKSVVSIPALGHDYKKISDKKATCTETGLEVYECSRCQHSYEKVVPKTEHVWETDVTVDIKATCENDGKQSIHCSKCNEVKDEQVIKATGHDYKKTVSKEPTCEREGSYLFKCSKCSKTYTEVIEKTGHSWDVDYTVDKQSTCKETGIKSIHCSKCDAKKDEQIIPISGHNFSNGICTSCGEKDPNYLQPETTIGNIVNGGKYPKNTVIEVPVDYVLKINGVTVNPVNGEYTINKTGKVDVSLVSPEGEEEKVTIEIKEDIPLKNETIVDKGEYKVGQTVDVADDEKLYVNGKEIASENLPYEIKTDGNYQITVEDKDGNKTNKDIVVSHVHSYKAELTKVSTCEEAGLYTYKCEFCDLSYTEEIRKLPHSYENNVCTMCGREEVITETVEVDTLFGYANNADYVLGSAIKVPDNGTLKVDDKIPELKGDEYIFDEEGTHYITFIDDDGDAKTITIIIKPKAVSNVSAILPGHDYAVGQSVDVPDDCKLVINGKEIAKEDLPYTFDSDGLYEVVVVDKEGQSSKKNISIQHTHAYGSEVTAEATCTGNGIVTFTCNTCNKKYTQVILKTGHSYTPWKVAKEPTCTEDGYNERTCTNCGNKQQDSINKLGHKYSTEFTIDREPTCTDDGSKSKHCTVCGEIKEDSITPIEALGHSLTKWTTDSEPTCTESGSKHSDCDRKGCDYVDTQVIPATGHNYSNEFTVDKEATCTEEGSKSKHCQNDGCDAKSDITTIPMVGHSYGEYATAKEPTCTEKGSEEARCVNCDAVDIREIPALGHALDNLYTTIKPATCTEPGSKYKRCVRKGCGGGSEPVEIPAKGHSWGEWVQTKAPNCMEFGEKKRTCSVCHKEETQEIPVKDADNHDYGDWVIVKEATCENAGSRKRTCNRCGFTANETVRPLGHKYKVVDCAYGRKLHCTNGDHDLPVELLDYNEENVLATGTYYIGSSVLIDTSDVVTPHTTQNMKIRIPNVAGYTDNLVPSAYFQLIKNQQGGRNEENIIDTTGGDSDGNIIITVECNPLSGTPSAFLVDFQGNEELDYTIPCSIHSYITVGQDTELGDYQVCSKCETPAHSCTLTDNGDTNRNTYKGAVYEKGSQYSLLFSDISLSGGTVSADIDVEFNDVHITVSDEAIVSLLDASNNIIDQSTATVTSTISENRKARLSISGSTTTSTIKGILVTFNHIHSWTTKDTDSEGYKYEVCSLCGEDKIPTNITMYNGNVVTGKTYVKDKLIKTVFTDLDFNSDIARFYVDTNFREARVDPVSVSGVAATYFTNGDPVDTVTKVQFQPSVNSNGDCVVRASSDALSIPRGEPCNLILSYGLV